MMLAETVRQAVAREIAPLLADCEAIRAELDRSEAALPILLGRHTERDAIRVRRAKLAAVMSQLQVDDLVKTIMRRAEEGG